MLKLGNQSGGCDVAPVTLGSALYLTFTDYRRKLINGKYEFLRYVGREKCARYSTIFSSRVYSRLSGKKC